MSFSPRARDVTAVPKTAFDAVACSTAGQDFPIYDCLQAYLGNEVCTTQA